LTNRHLNGAINQETDASKASNAREPSILFDLRLLEEMNDPEYLRDILHCVVTDMPDQLCELRDATVQKDFDRICFLSHRLKGTVGILQAVALRDLLSNIEEQANKRMDTTAITQTAITMYGELEKGLKEELLTRTTSHPPDQISIPYKCKR
jgi:HPt (histidine-containing phosphotransfer) domain-containing protein